MKIDIEGVESALSLCIKALKILHPVMDKDEPCIAHEAYESARWALRHLASQQAVEGGQACMNHDFQWEPDMKVVMCTVCGEPLPPAT